MLPITKQISKYNFSPGNTKKYIVLHDTGNYIDTDEGNANYFNEGNKGASAHYFVDENSVTQIVEDNMASWHCGDGKNKYGINNHNSIGVELCNDFGKILAATLSNSIDLIQYLMKKYNIDANHVVRHYDCSGKNCPQRLNNDGKWSLWHEFKKQLLPPIVIKKPSYQERYVREFQEFYNKSTKTTTPLVVDGIYGKNTQVAYDLLQKLIKGEY